MPSALASASRAASASATSHNVLIIVEKPPRPNRLHRRMPVFEQVENGLRRMHDPVEELKPVDAPSDAKMHGSSSMMSCSASTHLGCPVRQRRPDPRHARRTT